MSSCVGFILLNPGIVDVNGFESMMAIVSAKSMGQ